MQPVLLPLIKGIGLDIILIGTELDCAHPKLFVSVTLTFPVPTLFHFTINVLEVVPPTTIPPVTDQLYELPGEALTLYVSVLY